MVNIAVLGHGVVGSGVIEVLKNNAAAVANRAGEEVQVKYILTRRDYPGCDYAELFVQDFNTILNDQDVSIVVEAMGGVHPAYDYLKASLEAGKSAVTSNKELVAEKGGELLRIAKEHNVNFLFEASVAGGIPIIRPLHQCLAGNEILEIAGILNGTTNFILTKMIRDGMAFDEALALAQANGYAEADPTADIEGYDACRKICILASLAYGSHVYPKDVPTEGITNITPEDVQYAGQEGYVIKLIGRTHRAADGKIFAMVAPALVPAASQIGNVYDVFNCVLVRGNATDDVVFYGKGAGKLPTASAVVGDIVDCVKAKDTIISLKWNESEGGNITDYKKEPVKMYIRCKGTADPAKVFGEVKMLDSRANGEFAFFTPELPEGEIDHKLEQLDAEVMGKLRILEY